MMYCTVYSSYIKHIHVYSLIRWGCLTEEVFLVAEEGQRYSLQAWTSCFITVFLSQDVLVYFCR